MVGTLRFAHPTFYADAERLNISQINLFICQKLVVVSILLLV